jgi:hypothetical protein
MTISFYVYACDHSAHNKETVLSDVEDFGLRPED